ncbi:phytanoyl-CoA dioxygenase family protein [Leifsonia sp. ZF2019]|uniref:phytanoyl-CoA dioxygenase family protein n=1 Tax=Leifsonia sp. ZF2019 TaxID=2781978 RepID=UPI001CBD21A4|nr:phytanoyl-CoA dioxygenase family protein [Leifsonia sp. ZF2019]UAJ79516.1 phytanoyl-CoA dioxygenase family protein [Leifsonia sp. ZF2019]
MPSHDTSLRPFRDSTDLLGSGELLRRRADEDGYLFFRQLLPRADVERVRRAISEVLVTEGSLVDAESGAVDRAHVDAIPADLMRQDIGISESAYVAVQRVQDMHRLPHHPALLALYRDLFDDEVFVHPRHIVRAMTGHPALRPTPAHQDFPLIQGTQNTWTAWFPLADTPLERGPLSVLRGSHRQGYIPIAPAEGAGLIEAILCDEDDWVGGAFEAGDVLTFPSLLVHRAVPASARDTIRLSLDIRFQPVSEPVEERSLSNHSDHSWEEIYEGWQVQDVQYYWRDDAPALSPWNDELLQPGRRIC